MSKKIAHNIKVNTQALKDKGGKYILCLFVSGNLPNSASAVVNIKAICEKYLKDRYELEIIDIYKHPDLAITEQIVVLPVLIKKFPMPKVRMLGDLSNTEEVLKGLGLV
jgi:circadian clock protein KaiB